MKTRYPDYTNSNMNISCSILKYYGCDIRHNSLSVLDDILQIKKPRNVVFMLFDAMGISILNRHLPEDSFIRSHLVSTLSSTFPPTTVAATNSINSGLTPLETGWLGWITYFKEVDQNVVTFFNTKQSNEDEPLNVPHLAYSTLLYPSMSYMVKSANPDIKTMSFSPFPTFPTDSYTKTESIKDSCDRIVDMIKDEGRHFIYAYWPDPDSTMHEKGVDDDSITLILKEIDRNLESLASKIGDDTLVIVTADHSQINAKWFYLCDYPDVWNCMIRPHSIEGRAASLFIKDGMKEQFVKAFKKHFGDHFILMTHEEFLESGLLGSGVPHPRTDGFIGDYVAISTDEYCFASFHTDHEHKGMHAGLTEDEMLVPLIVL